MKKNDKEFILIDLKSFSIPAAIFLAGIMIAVGLFFGLKSTNLSEQSNISSEVEGEQVVNQSIQPRAQGQPVNQTTKTFIDDDAIMGNKNTARIAIVEFSDYECPFCERFWSQTLGQIKENYIDTRKAIFVYRDLPLDFHDPAATREANAAECARKFGGDETFYKFHDKIYEQTPGNGVGISENNLVEIGVNLGLNREKLRECVRNEEFAEEIRRDTEDARKAGISGTPGFVIGKLESDGTVEGIIVSGAQPYSVFQAIIEEQLR